MNIVIYTTPILPAEPIKLTMVELHAATVFHFRRFFPMFNHDNNNNIHNFNVRVVLMAVLTLTV